MVMRFLGIVDRAVLHRPVFASNITILIDLITGDNIDLSTLLQIHLVELSQEDVLFLAVRILREQL
jgi:hypothetical protein